MIMAASEEDHDENISIQNIDETNNDISTSVNGVQQQNVCTIVPSAGSNEILLYVGENASQNVQDLIRVALHQNLAASSSSEGDEGLQQQLQNVGAKITLQNIADTSAIISMPMPTGGIGENPTNLLQNEENVLTHHQTNQQVVNVVHHHGNVKPIEMNSLFQLASLTDNLVTGQETIPEDISVGTTDIKHDDENIIEDDGDKDASIGDFIIANIESSDHTTGIYIY